MTKNIFVYSDSGVHPKTFTQTIATLENQFLGKADVYPINAEEVINGSWKNNAIMFVMPGGADLPYAAKLNGLGNQQIKDFVSSGGIYLGICAGAYYGSKEIEFDKGGKLEVSGTRELGFFPGKSIGPALSFYTYENTKGATSAKISWPLEVLKMNMEIKLPLYHHGGGYFENAANFDNVKVLASYIIDDKKLPAIIKTQYGDGEAILSGVHFEIDPFSISNENDQDNVEITNLLYLLQENNCEREMLIKSLFGLVTQDKLLDMLDYCSS